MNKTKLFLLAILLLASFSMEAQKRARQEDLPVFSDEQRKQSIVYADGLRAFYSDNFTQAEKDFREVISKNPKNDAAFYMLSKIRSTQKDYDGAAYYLEEARKIDKSNEWYLIEMATVQDHLRDYKQSAKLWEEAAKLKPENEYYLIALAESYIQQEKYSDAIKTYDRLENLIGHHDELAEIKKSIFLFQNDIKNAVNEYEKLIAKYPEELKYYVEIAKIYMINNLPDKAYPYLQTALDKDKNNASVNLALSDYYERKGKKEEAYKALLTAFKDPNLPIANKMTEMHAYFNEAFKSKDEKAMKKTRQLADALTEAHPDAIEGWKIVAATQFLKENYTDARITFEKILSLDNTDYTVWADYLYVLMQSKEYQTIVNNAEELSELFPTHAEVLYNVGYAYLQLKQSDKAIDYLNQASMFAFDQHLSAAISASLGDAYLLSGNKSEAVKYWKQAQRKGINTPEIKDKIQKNE
ncbi:tetratricopeptide repeat protein [Bacteroidales bacterium OttesenSCG-928-B11]|nr:tetratricopeptide repeat protein [Bacteroidales bacterium OttesenSCG-928-E04]MDL2311256.1 tetratricopeptide repeat protein [Bacteroidales bacterium OttesenSCG-928-B11]